MMSLPCGEEIEMNQREELINKGLIKKIEYEELSLSFVDIFRIGDLGPKLGNF